LTVKPRSRTEIEAEELELQKELDELAKLEGVKDKVSKGKKSKKVVDNEESPAAAEPDDANAFLINYFTKKMWKEPKAAPKKGKFSTHDSDDDRDDDAIIDDDEDAKEIEVSELFESKYNFRFEELHEEKDKLRLKQEAESQDETEAEDDIDYQTILRNRAVSLGVTNEGMQVIGHARKVEGSIRREEEKRKQQRAERKERKEKEKRQKQEELKRLKNLKREEVSRGGIYLL
jgi:protein KRI1